MRYSKQDHERASDLLAHVKPGATIYYILRKAGGTGWRHYDFYTWTEGRPVRITWPVAVALGYPLWDATLRVYENASGSGVISNLSYHLFGSEQMIGGEEL